MRRTLSLGLLILLFICAGALASPARITLHIPPMASGTTPPSAERVARIERDIHKLAVEIGERNHERPAALAAAEAWAITELEAAGLQVVVEDIDGVGHNLVAERGSPGDREIIEVGAHLDTAPGTPGADDNASGVAALLELARNPTLGSRQAIRFVVYGNEEPPFFQTDRMGSRQHVRALRARGDRVVAPRRGGPARAAGGPVHKPVPRLCVAGAQTCGQPKPGEGGGQAGRLSRGYPDRCAQGRAARAPAATP